MAARKNLRYKRDIEGQVLNLEFHARHIPGYRGSGTSLDIEGLAHPWEGLASFPPSLLPPWDTHSENL